MKEKITPYLRSRLGTSAFDLQYRRDASEALFLPDDPLREEAHEVVKGLVHKYSNRALIKVSYECAAHCRFCTRIRQIGTGEGALTGPDINAIINYLTAHPEIDDVILSGGDPLYAPRITGQLLHRLRALTSIKVLRIGTRLPVHLPSAVSANALAPLLELIRAMSNERPSFILVHVNHPEELSAETLAALKVLRRTGATLLSQTVFLRGVNDDASTLNTLFTRLYHHGVLPYYIYHCDAVDGLERFTVPLAVEQAIMTEVHSTLSGIAVPRHVVDVAGGYGKLSVPQGFFGEDGTVLRDYSPGVMGSGT